MENCLLSELRIPPSAVATYPAGTESSSRIFRRFARDHVLRRTFRRRSVPSLSIQVTPAITIKRLRRVANRTPSFLFAALLFVASFDGSSHEDIIASLRDRRFPGSILSELSSAAL